MFHKIKLINPETKFPQPKNIKSKIDRRKQKIYELTGVNDRLVKKLNESLLNEEKLKDEIKNSSLQSI